MKQKLYLLLWKTKYKTMTNEWHCSEVQTDREIALLEYNLAKLKNPKLSHYLVEVDDPEGEEIEVGAYSILPQAANPNIAAESNEGLVDSSEVVDAVYEDPEILADAED